MPVTARRAFEGAVIGAACGAVAWAAVAALFQLANVIGQGAIQLGATTGAWTGAIAGAITAARGLKWWQTFLVVAVPMLIWFGALRYGLLLTGRAHRNVTGYLLGSLDKAAFIALSSLAFGALNGWLIRKLESK